MATPFPSSLGARFEVEEALTETPFERTFRAHDNVLQREVLLKLPAHAAFEGWTAPTKERLLREARALARIRHESVTPIHSVEETPEGPLLVLDLPEGELLGDRLQRGPLEIAEAVSIGVQIAGALAHVHLQGVVHRAVGPATVRVLANGRAQLGSFTFAKEFGVRGLGTSMMHKHRGTAEVVRHLPEYPAPEQLAGRPADPRVDVYALGCMLFHCLAGREAFAPGHEDEPPPNLRTLRKEVDKPLAEVVRKCMQPEKSARYATAQEVVDALQTMPKHEAGGVGRRWQVASLAGAAGLLLLLWIARGAWPGEAATRGNRTVDAVEDARYQETYGPDYARLHGLFIAIGPGYEGTALRKLENPVREVTAVAAQLRANDPMWSAPGAIKMLVDKEATFAAIQGELRRLAAEAAKEDAVLVYFSGHGESRGHSFGLCAQDVRGSLEDGTGYLRREVLHTFLEDCKSKHVLVVLDCCHSGSVFETGTIGASKGRVIDDRDANPGAHHRRNFSREFLCSAAANQQASDGHGLSPFCELLLQQLRQPATDDRQYIAARYLSGHVEEAMDQRLSRHGAMQVPKFRQLSEQQGSFVFHLAPPTGK